MTKRLEEIVWIGQRWVKSKDGSEVTPVPFGEIFVIRTRPEKIYFWARNYAEEQHLLSYVNAYSKAIDKVNMFGTIDNTRPTAIQLYRI